MIKDGDSPSKSEDGIDVVQPEKPAETSGKEGSGGASVDPANPEHSRLRQMQVETRAGYGDARDWALDLKTDLQLWRDDGLAWSEITTFAREWKKRRSKHGHNVPWGCAKNQRHV